MQALTSTTEKLQQEAVAVTTATVPIPHAEAVSLVEATITHIVVEKEQTAAVHGATTPDQLATAGRLTPAAVQATVLLQVAVAAVPLLPVKVEAHLVAVVINS